MTWNFTSLLSILLFAAIISQAQPAIPPQAQSIVPFQARVSVPSQAQSDSARYARYKGIYTISTPSFPVNEVTIFWQDSTLAFRAGGAHGILNHPDGERFHFISDDHEGTVTFKKDNKGQVAGIVILMDGETYEGTKKKPAAGSHR